MTINHQLGLSRTLAHQVASASFNGQLLPRLRDKVQFANHYFFSNENSIVLPIYFHSPGGNCANSIDFSAAFDTNREQRDGRNMK